MQAIEIKTRDVVQTARSSDERDTGGSHTYTQHNLPDVVLDGVGILLAPFLRDLLTYDREAVNEALGIFPIALTKQKIQS